MPFKPSPQLGVSTAAWIGLIKLYQWTLSPVLYGLGVRCRFYPSCSRYAQQAFAQYGTLRGLVWMVGRLLRCHPWHPGGWDPIPSSCVSGRKSTLP